MVSLRPSMSEGVIPWTNAHGVMPGQRKRPPNQRTENRLPERKRKHVAFASKKPGHHNAARERNRNQNRIRPVQRAEDGSGNQTNLPTICEGAEKTIGQIRLQRDLLQQTEREVAPEAAQGKQMRGKTVKRAEKESGEADSQRKKSKRNCGLPRGWLEIIAAPSKRLGSVPVNQEARRHPNSDHHPRPAPGELKPPDETGDIQRQSHSFKQADKGSPSPRRHSYGQGSAARRASMEALSPNVRLMCAKRSTLPGPKTKLPPSWNGFGPSLRWR